jgi:hypothetical protein
LLIDSIETVSQTKPLSTKAGEQPTPLRALLASHAGQTEEMKKRIGEWYAIVVALCFVRAHYFGGVLGISRCGRATASLKKCGPSIWCRSTTA